MFTQVLILLRLNICNMKTDLNLSIKALFKDGGNDTFSF